MGAPLNCEAIRAHVGGLSRARQREADRRRADTLAQVRAAIRLRTERRDGEWRQALAHGVPLSEWREMVAEEEARAGAILCWLEERPLPWWLAGEERMCGDFEAKFGGVA